MTDGMWPDVVSTVKVVLTDITEKEAHNAGAIRLQGEESHATVHKTANIRNGLNKDGL